MSLLKFGDTGTEVVKLQRLLTAQGFWDLAESGEFTSALVDAVKYFQGTHLGQDGKYLEADGIVGPLTWWALEHATGIAQKSNLLAQLEIYDAIPFGIQGTRFEVLRRALDEHRAGVREEPNGSNWGNEIQKYGGARGWAWCCLFVTWCWRQAKVIDFKEPSTYGLLKKASPRGWYYPLNSENPRAKIPGNALIWQHGKSRTGHISLIARVSKDGKRFNTIGGNEGNRVKFGIRDIKSRDLVGFINPFPEIEQPLDFERGLITANRVEGIGTR